MSNLKKEEVLQWYEQLLILLQEENITLDNPNDLMRIKFLNAKEDLQNPGRLDLFKYSAVYAFMRKKQGNDKDYLEYENPKPVISKDIALFQELYDAQMQANQAFLDKKALILKAIQEEEPIEDLQDTFIKALENTNQKSEVFQLFLDETLSEYDEWFSSNLKVFDAEKDYEQIVNLYKKSIGGLLYIFEYAREKKGHIKQILLDKDGNARLGRISSKMNLYKPSYAELGNPANKNLRAALQEKYNLSELPIHEEEIFYPKFLAKPKSPSVLSWMRLILSFGIEKDDFVEFKKHQDIYEQNQKEIEIYKQDFERVKEKNLQNYAIFDEILDAENCENYPNIDHSGKMAAMLFFINQCEIGVGAIENNGNIYNSYFETARLNRDWNRIFEAKEKPYLFNEDGNRNLEAYVLYRKAESDKRLEQEEQIIQDALDKKKAAPVPQQIIIKEELLQTIPDIEKPVDDFEKISLSALCKKIGALYGKDEIYGMKIFCSSCSQNQIVDKSGIKKEDFKTNEECYNDVENLLNSALAENNENAELLQSLDKALQKGLSMQQVIDSIPAILITEPLDFENLDIEKVSLPFFYGTLLLERLTRKNEAKCLEDRIFAEDKSDVSLSLKEERKFFIDCGRQIFAMQKK